jgi:beta-galactosidase
VRGLECRIGRPVSVKRWTLLGLVLASLGLARPTAAPAPSEPPHLILGTAWYPEQWPEERWDDDLRLMQAAGINMVRIGEFAWSRLEPEEGHYDLDWLARAVDKAAQHHIAVVLGTPTAAPPAWLTQKYPDTLRIDEHGRRAGHGGRQHFSFTSSRYRDFCRGIAEAMARRFGHHPNVLGWQIDNEYAEVSYDEDTRQKFQQWLQAKYRTLDNLNQHWTTAYWSQTYFDWSQIPIPVGYQNPGLMLEWKRFISDTWRDYQRNQLEVIRAHADPRQFITTNMMGWFDGYDHYVVSADLTLASWDDYVGQGQLDPDRNGMTHDLTRGFKRQNFWVMETQPGNVNWAAVNTFLNRGTIRTMAWQAVGHGADAVSYWQWRSALNGQEQYHGTLLGADGTPVPVYFEVQQIGREFAQASEALAGTSPESPVALLHDYDSRWAIDWQKHNAHYDQIQVFQSYYRALRALTQAMDVVNPYAPLERYKLVVAPDLNLIPDDLARNLTAYVRAGGHLVLGPRSGMKDQYNALLPQRQPGLLTEPLGGRVEQYYALDQDVPVSGDWGSGHASIWAEQLAARSPDVQVLLRYAASNGWLDHQPAVISRAYGKGRITYVGALLDDALMQAAARWMVAQAGLSPALGPVPPGVEVCRRVAPGGSPGTHTKEVFILINHTPQPQHVSLPRAMRSVLTGNQALSLDMPAYGVEVLVD